MQVRATFPILCAGGSLTEICGVAAQVLSDKLKAAATDVAALSQQQEAGTPEADALRVSIAKQQKKIDAMQRRSNEITDRLFSDFSRKVLESLPGLVQLPPLSA